jgi:hypothetical protein
MGLYVARIEGMINILKKFTGKREEENTSEIRSWLGGQYYNMCHIEPFCLLTRNEGHEV